MKAEFNLGKGGGGRGIERGRIIKRDTHVFLLIEPTQILKFLNSR